MKQVLHILKYKLISFLKPDTKYQPGKIVKSLGSITIYTSFGLGAFLFGYQVVAYLLEELKIGLFLLHEFISIILFIFFLSVNIGNIVVSYSTLYKSTEVDFLFSKPVSATKIFAIKFLDNFFYSSSTLILILVSILAGYAAYLKLSIYEIVLLLLFNFIPFMLIAAALGIIILLTLLRLSVFIGPRIIIGIISLLYIAALVIFFNTTSPVDTVNKVMEYYPNVDRYFSDFVPGIITYLPNYWLSQSMYWITRDIPVASGKFFYLQIVVCSALITTALFVGSRWYRKTWFYDFTLRNRYNSKKNKSFFSFENSTKFSPFTESIFKREFFNFIREPSQVFHSLVLLGLIIIFLSSVTSLVKLSGMNFFMQTVIYLSVMIFNIFLISTLSLRFVYPLISLEGQVFWKIKSAPIDITHLTKKKIVPYFAVISFVGLLLNFVVNLEFGAELMAVFSVVTLASAVLIIFLNYSMGGLFAVYNEKNPVRIASSQGASLCFLLNLFYMIFLTLVLFGPLHNYFTSQRFGNYGNTDPLMLPAASIVMLSFAVYLGANTLLKKSLNRDF